MGRLFETESLVFCYSNVEAAKRWWMEAFDCKQVALPEYWDDPLPSDVALQMPGDAEPMVLLCDRGEVERGQRAMPATVPIIFSGKLRKAYEHLLNRGVLTGPIQDSGDTRFFEVRDLEGNVIEICSGP
ncbi:MAG: VOC family protein [bacterium]